MRQLTRPVQARKEANLMIDIPDMYLVIFQSSHEDEDNLWSWSAMLRLEGVLEVRVRTRQ